jgi:hypothetical protein
VAIEEHTHVDPEGSLFGELLDLSRRSWKGDRGVAIATMPNMQGFFAALTRRASELGWLSVWTLRLDGRLVAMEYQLRHDGRVNALRADFDPALREVSPGSALNFAVARALFERGGVHEYDMGPGLNEYKLRWATDSHDAGHLMVYRPTVYGRLLPPAGLPGSARGPSRPGAAGMNLLGGVVHRERDRPVAAALLQAMAARVPGAGTPLILTSGNVGFFAGASGKVPKRYDAATAARRSRPGQSPRAPSLDRPRGGLARYWRVCTSWKAGRVFFAISGARSRLPSGIPGKTHSGSAPTILESSSSTTQRRRTDSPSPPGLPRSWRFPVWREGWTRRRSTTT